MSEHWRGTGRTNTTSVSIVHICTERPCHPVWMLPHTITTHTPIQPVQPNCWPLCRVLLCCTRIWLHYVARLCSWSFSKNFPKSGYFRALAAQRVATHLFILFTLLAFLFLLALLNCVLYGCCCCFFRFNFPFTKFWFFTILSELFIFSYFVAILSALNYFLGSNKICERKHNIKCIKHVCETSSLQLASLNCLCRNFKWKQFQTIFYPLL